MPSGDTLAGAPRAGERRPPMTPAQIDDVASASSGTLAFDPLHLPATRDGGKVAWYDVFQSEPERYVFALGETAGGPDAVAALGAAVREAFAAPAAAPAMHGSAVPSPAALVAIIDCRDATLSYANTSGPAPCIRFRDGSAAALPTGTVLDAGGVVASANVIVDLAGAAAVVFAAGGPGDAAAATEGLRTALESLRPDQCERPIRAIADRFVPAERADEFVLLGVAFGSDAWPASGPQQPGTAPRWSVTWSFDTTAAAAPAIRRAFMTCLRAKHGTVPLDLEAAELVFGEMLGNVVRHAPGPVEITLDWTGDLPELHMLDEGPGFGSRRSRERLPRDDWSESGRGLFIINACATAFRLRSRGGRRGSHASATLRPADIGAPSLTLSSRSSEDA